MQSIIKEILHSTNNEPAISDTIMKFLYTQCHVCKIYIQHNPRRVIDKKIWKSVYVCNDCFCHCYHEFYLINY